MTRSVKAYLQTADPNDQEVRRFNVDRDVESNFVFLQGKIAHIFPSLLRKNYHLYWKDEEGDLIKFSSDEELSDALQFYGNDLFKLYVTVVPSDASPPLTSKTDTPLPDGPHHLGVICDVCDSDIKGIRYKCLVCADYDLCMKCERDGQHTQHHMVRIANPLNPWQRGFRRRGQGHNCRFTWQSGPTSQHSSFGTSAESTSEQQQQQSGSNPPPHPPPPPHCGTPEDFLKNMGEHVATMLDPFGINVDVHVDHNGQWATYSNASSSTSSSSTTTSSDDDTAASKQKQSTQQKDHVSSTTTTDEQVNENNKSKTTKSSAAASDTYKAAAAAAQKAAELAAQQAAAKLAAEPEAKEAAEKAAKQTAEEAAKEAVRVALQEEKATQERKMASIAAEERARKEMEEMIKKVAEQKKRGEAANQQQPNHGKPESVPVPSSQSPLNDWTIVNDVTAPEDMPPHTFTVPQLQPQPCSQPATPMPMAHTYPNQAIPMPHMAQAYPNQAIPMPAAPQSATAPQYPTAPQAQTHAATPAPQAQTHAATPAPQAQTDAATPAPQPVLPHSDPDIARIVEHLQAMGYGNEEGWLTKLVETKRGNINLVLDALSPHKK